MNHRTLRRWLGTLAFVALAGVGALFAQAVMQTTTGIVYVRAWTGTLTGTELELTNPEVTAGSGTGVTVNVTGAVRRVVYKVTVTSGQWITNGTTHDFTVATLPAKSRVTDVVADLTTTFACTATCTSSTLAIVVGKGSGGSEYLDSFDADATTATFGDVDSERGGSLQGVINGEVTWGSTQAIVARLISSSGNVGNGTVTNLSKGTVTFYITTEEMP
ncbi:hypothetical protein LCGC14_0897280 [marine sediment metagenome]|uniref:Uncharacterized protein n=1 Tax=marine sediment metagenome TaxID=412755 RepID=A0A0F9PI82_9ZZZZ